MEPSSYSSRMNVNVKVLDFVKSGGPEGTVERTLELTSLAKRHTAAGATALEEIQVYGEGGRKNKH